MRCLSVSHHRLDRLRQRGTSGPSLHPQLREWVGRVVMHAALQAKGLLK